MQKHVLVVEDEEVFATPFCSHLKEAGFEVAHVNSVKDAEKKLDGFVQLDGVFLDLYLQDGSGLSLLPRLRKIHPKIPVVVFTGVGYEHALIDQAMNLGATAYFSKEMKIENVILLFQRLLKKEAGPPGET